MSNYRHAPSTASETSHASDARGSASGTDGTNEGAWRKVDAANRRFSDNEKYSGILAESPSLAEARNTYITYCNQKEFSRADRVKLISCVLKGPALNYWMSNIEGKDEFTELASVFKQFEIQFDTPAHQRQIESLAYSMTLEEARKKKNCNRIAALGYLYHEVARLNEQFPKVKRGEQFRTQTLMKIVERYEWSRTAAEEVMQDTLNFDSLYTKISASIVIWENEVLRSGHDPDLADDRRKPVWTATSFVGYVAQYANPVQRRLPAALSMASPRYHHRRQTSTQNSFAPSRFQKRDNRDNRSKNETHCFKCGQQGHWRAECNNNATNSLLNATRSRIRELGGQPNEAAARVLFELVTEEDACNESNKNAEDEGVFAVLVNEHLLDTHSSLDDPQIDSPAFDHDQVFSGAGGQ
jgi:hypothetical protein